MALLHSFEQHGNQLFKIRGQVPVLLFLMAIPVIFFTDSITLSAAQTNIYKGCAFIAIVLGTLIRAYAIGTTPRGTSGRNTNEQVAEQLNSTGIYSTVRHPLYLGNYLMWIGIVIFTYNIYFIIIVSLLFWLYYERIMFAEERFLEKKFGKQYTDWSLTVPAFIPALGKFTSSSIPFSFKSVLRREYSGVLAVVIGVYFVKIIRNLMHSDSLNFKPSDYVVIVVAVGITLVLRTLKHTTQLLDEEGRS